MKTLDELLDEVRTDESWGKDQNQRDQIIKTLRNEIISR